MRTTTSVGTTRVTASVAGALTLAVLPAFLLGASTDAIRTDLGVSETAIGAAVTVLFTTVGLAAGVAGRVTERVGAGTALRAGIALSALASTLVAMVASSWWTLAAPLILTGVAVGLVDTGGARTFADRLRADRQGLAFGIKEASVPSASLLAGAALPTITAWFDWRAAFLLAPAAAVLVLVGLPGRGGDAAGRGDAYAAATAPDRNVEEPGPPQGGTVLGRFAVAVGLGAAAATAAPTFLVPASTARGLTPVAAGGLLVVASLASILVRIGTGRWADREDVRPAPAVAASLGIGAIGAVLLAAPVPLPLVVVGAVLLLGGGWGWTGLAFLAAVRARPDAPAVAAGTVLTGLGVGGAAGPLAFGALAEHLSYATAWVATASVLLGAGALAAAATGRTTGPGAPPADLPGGRPG